MSKLPAYTPSGQGGQKDLEAILKAQIIAWGGFKGQFKNKYTNLAGTSYVEGHEVFNDMSIMYDIGNSRSPKYKFMKFMGFDKKDMTRLNEKYQDHKDDIEDISLRWSNKFSAEEDDWNMWIREVEKMCNGITRFSIEAATRDYEIDSDYVQREKQYVSIANVGVRVTTEDNTIYHGLPQSANSKIQDDFILVGGNKKKLNPTRVGAVCKVHAYRGNQLIDSEIGYSGRRLLLTLALLLPQVVRRQKVETYYSTYEDKSGWVTRNWERVSGKETFVFNPGVDQVLKNRHQSWTTQYSLKYPHDNDADLEEKESRVSNYTQTRWFWINMRMKFRQDIYKISNGRFVSDPLKPYYDPKTGIVTSIRDNKTLQGEFTPSDTGEAIQMGVLVMPIHMVKDNIMKEKQDNFGYFVSKFLDIYIKPKKGNFIQKFFGGLMRAFMSMIEALTGLMMRIPILKQMVEILIKIVGKMFGVSAEGALAILNQIIMAVVMIFLTALSGGIFGATGSSVLGTGLSTGLVAGITSLVTYSQYALQIYNSAMMGKSIAIGIEEEEQARKKRDKKYLEDKGKKAINDAMMGTMGTKEQHEQSDLLMYDVMFNPFYYFRQALEPEETI